MPSHEKSSYHLNLRLQTRLITNIIYPIVQIFKIYQFM